MVERTFDVVVVGAGAAGIAAAVAAARRGCRTALLERYGFAGGMATAGAVGTICGAFYRSPEAPRPVHRGFPAEFCDQLAARGGRAGPVRGREGLWFLPYRPDDFIALCDELLGQHGVEIFFHTTVFGVSRSGPRLEAVDALVYDRPARFTAGAFIDCSGEASLTALAGSPLLEESDTQAGALVFELCGLEGADEELLWRLIVRELARAGEQGNLPLECSRISLVPGSFRRGRAAFKLSVPEARGREFNALSRLEPLARARVRHFVGWLKDTIPACRESELLSVAPQCGIRTGPRPAGRYTLEEGDVLELRTFPDAIARGAWPIEEWGTERGPRLTCFEVERHYEIPARALQPIELSNLLCAGRNMAATPRAIASARVIGTCLATGTAAGLIAAGAVGGGRMADGIDETLVASIQRELF